MYFQLSIVAILLFSGVLADEFCPVQPTTTPVCNTPENRQCWGEYDIHTDYSVVFPETNIVREVEGAPDPINSFLLTYNSQYDIVASNMWIAPDGVDVLGMVFNGQFPGPTIEVKLLTAT